MKAQKGQSGHYIGHVEAGLPAELAGLREGDRIIEVNGINVEGASHREVAKNIKVEPDETSLLVLDPEADKVFSEKGIVLSGALNFIERLSTPDSQLPDNWPSAICQILN